LVCPSRPHALRRPAAVSATRHIRLMLNWASPARREDYGIIGCQEIVGSATTTRAHGCTRPTPPALWNRSPMALNNASTPSTGKRQPETGCLIEKSKEEVREAFAKWRTTAQMARHMNNYRIIFRPWLSPRGSVDSMKAAWCRQRRSRRLQIQQLRRHGDWLARLPTPLQR
jgi:hypothetical protein